MLPGDLDGDEDVPRGHLGRAALLHLDEVVAEGGQHRLRHRADRKAEAGPFEGGVHAALAELAQAAALGAGHRVGGFAAGDLFERRAALDLLAEVERPLAGGGGIALVGQPNQLDVAQVGGCRPLELVPIAHRSTAGPRFRSPGPRNRGSRSGARPPRARWWPSHWHPGRSATGRHPRDRRRRSPPGAAWPAGSGRCTGPRGPGSPGSRRWNGASAGISARSNWPSVWNAASCSQLLGGLFCIAWAISSGRDGDAPAPVFPLQALLLDQLLPHGVPGLFDLLGAQGPAALPLPGFQFVLHHLLVHLERDAGRR